MGGETWPGVRGEEVCPRLAPELNRRVNVPTHSTRTMPHYGSTRLLRNGPNISIPPADVHACACGNEEDIVCPLSVHFVGHQSCKAPPAAAPASSPGDKSTCCAGSGRVAVMRAGFPLRSPADSNSCHVGRPADRSRLLALVLRRDTAIWGYFQIGDQIAVNDIPTKRQLQVTTILAGRNAETPDFERENRPS
ncbi:hypothetical protein Bbelb_295400 [Branchiostoma belcheri]|nr:hypothetical protein Bbelb_295400 [Branchiostoma belcheri]